MSGVLKVIHEDSAVVSDAVAHAEGFQAVELGRGQEELVGECQCGTVRKAYCSLGLLFQLHTEVSNVIVCCNRYYLIMVRMFTKIIVSNSRKDKAKPEEVLGTDKPYVPFCPGFCKCLVTYLRMQCLVTNYGCSA